MFEHEGFSAIFLYLIIQIVRQLPERPAYPLCNARDWVSFFYVWSTTLILVVYSSLIIREYTNKCIIECNPHSSGKEKTCDLEHGKSLSC